MKNFLKLHLIVFLFLAAVQMNLSAEKVPIRIMPLGDSITDGAGAPGGYRAPLYNILTNAGFKVDFIGTQTDNGAPGLPDPDHEGHSGWLIGQIDSIIEGVFSKVSDPDIILLLIGTNDYGTGYDTPHAIDRLEGLVARMATNRPYAKIIVGNLLVRGEPYNTQIQTTFNPFIPAMVKRQQALGREVYFDDIRSAVPLSDFPDQLHPSAVGYAKMATNWFGVITNLFTPEGSKDPPGITRAYGWVGLTNVTLVFSKPVADDSANPANFTLSGGLSVIDAVLDPTTRQQITLSTSSQKPSTTYTVTVNGIHDRTTAQSEIATNSTISFTSLAGRGAAINVAESANYQLVYSLDIPDMPNYADSLAYTLDRRTEVHGFSRIAYYLELQQPGSPLSYMWVSTDAFTDDVNKIGVPTAASGAFFQQAITNMNVQSSVAQIVSGTNLSGGNIEFWPMNTNPANSANVANASGAAYDWGDSPAAGNYGSMQIHNHDARQVLFAFNRWGGFGGVADIGIGNRAGNYLDWMFAQNASTYIVKTLQVFVLPTPPPLSINRTYFSGPSQFTLRWDAKIGNTYSIFKKLALDTPAWTKIGEVVGVTNTAAFTDFQSADSTSFYRISSQGQ
jgi:lysophospholipase L1-like esterase